VAARTTEQVAELLAATGLNESGDPVGYTYRELAAEVYETNRPTRAQLAAVRRSVVKLVDAGLAQRGERSRERIDLDPETHKRTNQVGTTYESRNPAGIVVSRVPTEDDVDWDDPNAWGEFEGP
jgi:hypothetical protein